ncbi:MAG: TetR/AcrR family transcriptional regulator [Nostocoides sp.]
MSTVRRRPLDRHRVIDAAVDLADHVGLEAMSMRKLADQLCVTPMALYKHVASREELLDGMVDHLAGQIANLTTGLPWKSAVRERILSAHELVQAHPWARSAIETRTQAGPAVLAYLDSLMGLMFDGGLSADLVHHAMHALSTRMWGFTSDVLPTPALSEDPIRRDAELASFAATYPNIVVMVTTAPHAGITCNERAEFEFALDILLNAIERLHDTGWRSDSATAGEG